MSKKQSIDLLNLTECSFMNPVATSTAIKPADKNKKESIKDADLDDLPRELFPSNAAKENELLDESSFGILSNSEMNRSFGNLLFPYPRTSETPFEIVKEVEKKSEENRNISKSIRPRESFRQFLSHDQGIRQSDIFQTTFENTKGDENRSLGLENLPVSNMNNRELNLRNSAAFNLNNNQASSGNVDGNKNVNKSFLPRESFLEFLSQDQVLMQSLADSVKPLEQTDNFLFKMPNDPIINPIAETDISLSKQSSASCESKLDSYFFLNHAKENREPTLKPTLKAEDNFDLSELSFEEQVRFDPEQISARSSAYVQSSEEISNSLKKKIKFEKPQTSAFSSFEFISSETAKEEFLNRKEEEYKEENRFDGYMDPNETNASWFQGTKDRDPSILDNDGDISIGAYFNAKSGDIGQSLLEAMPSKIFCEPEVPEQVMQMNEKVETGEEEISNSDNVSFSSISHLVSDSTLAKTPKLVAQRFMDRIKAKSKNRRITEDSNKNIQAGDSNYCSQTKSIECNSTSVQTIPVENITSSMPNSFNTTHLSSENQAVSEENARYSPDVTPGVSYLSLESGNVQHNLHSNIMYQNSRLPSSMENLTIVPPQTMYQPWATPYPCHYEAPFQPPYQPQYYGHNNVIPHLPGPPSIYSGYSQSNALLVSTAPKLPIISNSTASSPICIGDSYNFKIPLKNPNFQKINFIVEIISIILDGKPLDESGIFVLEKSHFTLDPNSSITLQVTLNAKFAGTMTGNMVVRTPDSLTGMPSSSRNFSLTAQIEQPMLSFSCNEILDFGYVSERLPVIQKINIINNGNAEVPLKIVINSDSFTLNFGMLKTSNPANSDYDVVSLAEMICRIPGQANGQPGSFSIPITCRIINAKGKEAVVGLLQIGTRSKFDSKQLMFTQLSAKVGRQQLVVKNPPEGEILFNAIFGKKSCKIITLKNEGNVFINGELSFHPPIHGLTITPESINLKENDTITANVWFSYTSPLSSKTECFLKANVGDSSPNLVKVKIIPVHDLPSKTGKEQKLTLETSRKYLVWGGVDLGTTETSKFKLRNRSTTKSVTLSLFFNQNKKGFMIMKLDGTPSEVDTRKLGPSETTTITIAFTPTHYSTYKERLVIKGEMFDKCAVELEAYGGTSILKFNKILELNENADGELTSHFITENDSKRVAFAKVVGYTDNSLRQQIDSNNITIQPSEFVIIPKTKKPVIVSCKNIQTNWVLVIYWGDEILRQAMRIKPSGENMKTVDFTSHFIDEELSPNDSDYKLPKNWSLFFDQLNQTIIHLQKPDDNFTSMSVCQDTMLDATISSTSKMILPSLSTKSSVSPSNWSVLPDPLIFQSGEESKAISISNCSESLMHFKAFSPSPVFKISPSEDSIQSKSVKDVTISIVDQTLVDPTEEYMVMVNVKGIIKKVKILFKTNLLPNLSLEFPDTLDLPHVNVGERSETIFTVLNPTDEVAYVSLKPVEKMPSNMFQIIPLECSIAPMKSQVFKALFRPTKYKASVVEAWRAKIGSTYSQTIMLKGYCVSPLFSQSSSINAKQGLYLREDVLDFGTIEIGSVHTKHFVLNNSLSDSEKVKVISPTSPFLVKHSELHIRSHFYLSVPVYFTPQTRGNYSQEFTIKTSRGNELKVSLIGAAM